MLLHTFKKKISKGPFSILEHNKLETSWQGYTSPNLLREEQLSTKSAKLQAYVCTGMYAAEVFQRGSHTMTL